MKTAKENGSLFTREQEERLAAWKKRYPYPIMGIIEALRDVQQWHRRVSPKAEARIAELFQIPLHQVRELVTFYPYFTTEPTGRCRIQVCRNLSCHLAGSTEALEHLRSSLGVEEGAATPDGLFSYESAECLGACDFAPAFTVNDELIGSANAGALDRILSEARSGKERFDAQGSAPIPGDCGRRERGEGRPAATASGVRILTEHFGEAQLHSLEIYRRGGGYRAWEKAKSLEAARIIAEVKKSNLRGLGGAGFPSGMKWETVPPKKGREAPHYLVANADESEPGCFKDRVLMERNPHALIEGMLIAGRAIQADGLFIFIRGEYARQGRVLEAAIREAFEAGILKQDIFIMRGANAYISGCDTALLETMEGKKAWPRQPPPFPTTYGLMGHPTVVNNVETLMMVPSIIDKGGEWFAKLGVAKSGGTAVYSVSGHVERPGAYEFQMGTPLKTILAAAGGVRAGRSLKAVIPGGTSTPVLTAEEALRVSMDFDGLRSVGSFLGAGGVVVLDETADMVETLRVIERFLAHESCGQCTPCREGSRWTARILGRILSGGGVPEDIENLVRIGDNITGKVICALGDTVGMVAHAMIAKFRPEFEKKVAAAEPASPALRPSH